MAPAAAVKRLVAPLLQRNPDLALVKRLVVLAPVRHILRGILIDRRSSSDRFEPAWFAWPLFGALDRGYLRWSNPMFRRRGQLPWTHSEPDIEEHLGTAVEEAALPTLRTIETISDFETYARSKPHLPHWLEYLQYSSPLAVARGDLDGARKICDEHICPRDVATFGQDDEDKAKLLRLKELCRRLAADDRAGLAALLHEWEAATVKNLKLEHLWEPTPFPLEEQFSATL